MVRRYSKVIQVAAVDTIPNSKRWRDLRLYPSFLLGTHNSICNGTRPVKLEFQFEFKLTLMTKLLLLYSSFLERKNQKKISIIFPFILSFLASFHHDSLHSSLSARSAVE